MVENEQAGEIEVPKPKYSADKRVRVPWYKGMREIFCYVCLFCAKEGKC